MHLPLMSLTNSSRTSDRCHLSFWSISIPFSCRCPNVAAGICLDGNVVVSVAGVGRSAIPLTVVRLGFVLRGHEFDTGCEPFGLDSGDSGVGIGAESQPEYEDDQLKGILAILIDQVLNTVTSPIGQVPLAGPFTCVMCLHMHWATVAFTSTPYPPDTGRLARQAN